MTGEKFQLPLTLQQQGAVCKRVDAGPTDRDGVCSLRGKDVQRIPAEEFG